MTMLQHKTFIWDLYTVKCKGNKNIMSCVHHESQLLLKLLF